MIQRNYAVLLAFALCAGTAAISGCSGSTSPGSASSGQNQQVAKTDVTFSAAFPTSGGAVKSLIPATAQAIEVYAQKQPFTFTNYTSSNPYQMYGTLIATLTPAAPSQTVQIAAGQYKMYAIAWDSTVTATRKEVGRTMSGGEVLAGQSNSIVLTFLDGQWTIVDANDLPSSVVLSNGTALNDMIVAGDSQPPMYYKAGKSAMDYTRPIGYGGGNMRLRFSGYTSARTYGGMMSQFIGTTSTTVHSSGYNFTKKCSQDSMNCSESAGDQIIMVSSKGDGSEIVGASAGAFLIGLPYDLLPGKGKTSFTQNGTALDLMAALPDTVVTGGNLITGGIVEWLPSSNRVVTFGTPAAAKRAISAKAVKAQSTNTPYTGLAIKDYQILVCSGSSPQNRGTWTFANNTSAGKVVLGNKVCYDDWNTNVYLDFQIDPMTGQYYTNPGDYSYGLLPTTTDYGDYCHVWDGQLNIYGPTGMTPNPNYNTCKQQLPGSGEIYQPWNFMALKTTTKTAISFGSFKFNFWGESNQTGAAYVYPFRAKGSTTITPAR